MRCGSSNLYQVYLSKQEASKKQASKEVWNGSKQAKQASKEAGRQSGVCMIAARAVQPCPSPLTPPKYLHT